MLPTMSRIYFGAVLAAALAVTTVPASAQNYPSGPVHMIVGYAVGGTGDTVIRIMAPKLSEAFGQSVIVENRAGASGAIAAHGVAIAAPDGLTLLVGQTAEMAVNQYLIKGLNYDAQKDLQPVALLAVVPLAFVVPAKSPYSTVAELLAGLKTTKMTFASAGPGTPGHFAGEYLKLMTKGDMTHVPYKGAGPALNDVIGYHVDMYFPGMPAAVPHVKAGTVKLLGVSSAKRTALAPEVPTVLELSGFKDFDFTLWVGVFAPRATPQPVIAKLNSELNKLLNDPETKKRLFDAGADAEAMSVEQTRAFVAAEAAKYGRLVKDIGMTPE